MTPLQSSFVLVLGLFLVSPASGTVSQWISYQLSYATLDCTGPPYAMRAANLSVCTPVPCAASLGVLSQQTLCYAGSFQTFVSPMTCPTCAYCGSSSSAPGVNCVRDQWSTLTLSALGACSPGGNGQWTKAYGCWFDGTQENLTTYSDAACTRVTRPSTGGAGSSACVPSSQPACTCQTLPGCTPATSQIEGICSYTGLTSGNGTGTLPGAGTMLKASTGLYMSLITAVAAAWAVL